MGDWVTIWIGATIGTFLAIVLLATVAFCFSRGFVRWAVGHFVKIVMNDRYPENIGEIVSALTRVSPQKVLENSLRSAEGIAIDRPFGSPRKFLDYDSLLFSPAQLAVLPAPESAKVEMRLTIGPMAKKPLTLEIPLLAGAIGFWRGCDGKSQDRHCQRDGCGRHCHEYGGRRLLARRKRERKIFDLSISFRSMDKKPGNSQASRCD